MKSLMLGSLCLVIGGLLGVGIYFWQYQSPQELTAPITEISVSPSPQTAFSLEQAPKESLRGAITEMNTDVWWESRVATEPAKLTQKIPLQQGEVLIASDSGQVTAHFPNVLTFSLTPKTKVEITQTLPVNFVFNQYEGQARYETSGTSLVSVRSLRLLTTVSQGILDLSIDQETHVITVTLENGQAKVAFNSPDFESQIVELVGNKTFIFDNDNRTGRLL